MIPKQLAEIAEADLLALISNGVAEGRTIDYKRDMPGNSEGDKKEFLADVSSFANAGGGDLVFGMEEAGGLPTNLIGLASGDLDFEIRRLDSIMAAGLIPRIRYGMRIIMPATGNRSLVLRVERSWIGPHRVVFQGHDKFYGRNSAGKYPLDVNELRAAFTLSSSAIERIRAFRTDRIIALYNNQTPLPFVDTPKVVLHCIPLEAFAGEARYDVLRLRDNRIQMVPMGTSAWDVRLNLEGVLAFSIHQPCNAYTQVHRNGVLEAVQGRILAQQYQGRPVIPSIAYERTIFEYLPRCFQLLDAVGVTMPIMVALTLIGVKGLYMGVDNLWGETGYPINSDTLVLPETIVETPSTPTSQVLKPVFDLIWNACGFPGSTNFDENGNWRPPR
jgi:hypothetical protein